MLRRSFLTIIGLFGLIAIGVCPVSADQGFWGEVERLGPEPKS